MATAEVAEVAEVVADHIEDVAEVTRAITSREVGIAVVAGAIGIGGGAAIGYILSRKKLERKYQQFAEEEILEMKNFYTQRELAREQKPELDRVVEELGYKPTEKGRETPTVEIVPPAQEEVAQKTENVFEKVVPDAPAPWDYATEAAGRSHDGPPYIIHAEEYKENEHSFDQVTYTWYEDDDVLTDVRDNIIDDVDGVVGLENLQKFGHGSNDPSIVYVRNVKLELEFEIVRNPGNFGEQVHGFIKHSDDFSHRRKRRFDDDTRR